MERPFWELEFRNVFAKFSHWQTYRDVSVFR